MNIDFDFLNRISGIETVTFEDNKKKQITITFEDPARTGISLDTINTFKRFISYPVGEIQFNYTECGIKVVFTEKITKA